MRFTKHSIELGKLAAKLDSKPRHTRVEKEMAIPYPGSQDEAVKPDVLTFTPNPRDGGKTVYLTAWELYTGHRDDTKKMRRQANAWYAIMNKYKRKGTTHYIPRFVFVNSTTGKVTRVSR